MYFMTYSDKSQFTNDSHSSKAKQINILGSRQHAAEKVALWCEFFFFFFFKRGQIAGYSYAYKYYLMVYEQYKFHLSIVCDM